MSQPRLFPLRLDYHLTGNPRPHRTARGAAMHEGRPSEEVPASETVAWANAKELGRQEKAKAKAWRSVG